MRIIENDSNGNPVFLAEHSNWQIKLFTFPFFAMFLGGFISVLPKINILSIVTLLVSLLFGTFFFMRTGVIFKPQRGLIITFWGPFFIKFRNLIQTDNIEKFRVTRDFKIAGDEDNTMVYSFSGLSGKKVITIVNNVDRSTYKKILNTLDYYSKEIVLDWDDEEFIPEDPEIYNLSSKDLPDKTITKFEKIKDGIIMTLPAQNLRSYLLILFPFVVVITPIVIMVPVSKLMFSSFPHPFHLFALGLALFALNFLRKIAKRQKIRVSVKSGLTITYQYFIWPKKVVNIPGEFFKIASVDEEGDEPSTVNGRYVTPPPKFYEIFDSKNNREITAYGENGSFHFGYAVPFNEKIFICNIINKILGKE